MLLSLLLCHFRTSWPSTWMMEISFHLVPGPRLCPPSPYPSLSSSVRTEPTSVIWQSLPLVFLLIVSVRAPAKLDCLSPPKPACIGCPQLFTCLLPSSLSILIPPHSPLSHWIQFSLLISNNPCVRRLPLAEMGDLALGWVCPCHTAQTCREHCRRTGRCQRCHRHLPLDHAHYICFCEPSHVQNSCSKWSP